MPSKGSAVPNPDGEAVALGTGTYRFKVDGTRPVLDIELSSGKKEEAAEGTEKVSIELHTPISGEIFEARTSMGRLEVDRNGRVMYFCQKGEKVGFTLFVGRSVVVTMSRTDGEVLIQSPSRILSVSRVERAAPDDLGNPPPTDAVRIVLE